MLASTVVCIQDEWVGGWGVLLVVATRKLRASMMSSRNETHTKSIVNRSEAAFVHVLLLVSAFVETYMFVFHCHHHIGLSS